MYYAELGQRDIYVWDDPLRGFRIWGELTGGGENTAIPLCEVYLEYAMQCHTYNDETQAYYQMESFGIGLGQALAIYIQDNILGKTNSYPGICALECLLESLNMNFTLHQVGPELRFTRDAVIAVTGAQMAPKLDGATAALNESIAVKAGTVVSFDFMRLGARAYLAVAGGIDVPAVLGSRSTYGPEQQLVGCPVPDSDVARMLSIRNVVALLRSMVTRGAGAEAIESPR